MLQLTTVMTHLEDIEKKTAEFAQWFESSRLQTTTIEAFIKHSHLCIDQYDRLIQQPEAHLQKLDSVLAQLNRQADAARLTQLQLLVCNYFNPSFQSSSSNSTFFQQQELKAVNEIEKTFMQNTKNIGKLPEPLQRLIKVIQSEMEWAVFEDKVAAPQTGVC